MDFKDENVYTGLNIEDINIGDKGYFAHNIMDLKRQVWNDEPINEYTGRSSIGYFFNENTYNSEKDFGYPFFYLVEKANRVVPMNLEEILQAVKKDAGFVKYRDDNNSIHIYQLERLDFDDPNPLTVNGVCYTVSEFVNKFTMSSGWRFEKNE